jgi:hypothetical protein
MNTDQIRRASRVEERRATKGHEEDSSSLFPRPEVFFVAILILLSPYLYSSVFTCGSILLLRGLCVLCGEVLSSFTAGRGR